LGSCSQEFFRSKGWENKPIRCEGCRKAKKQQQEGQRGGYNQGGGFGGGNFGGGAFGGQRRTGGGSCYNCGKVSGPFWVCRLAVARLSLQSPRALPSFSPLFPNHPFSALVLQEGHMSRDCPEPRKAQGAPSGGNCFKCGQPGHKS
jgi:hypothetical protein